MKTELDADRRGAELMSDSDRSQRATALLRLITYARDEAVRLDIDFLAFCLDASLAAAQDELTKRPSAEDESKINALSILDCVGDTQLH